MQNNSQKYFKVLFLLLCFLQGVGIYAQSPEKPTKEQKKQAEQERKDREKQAKAQTLVEKLIPVGKETNYDRFNDTTTVNTKGMIVYPMDRDIRFEIAYVGLWALYSVQGQFGSAPPSVRLFLHGQTLLIGTPNNPCSLSMILNGTERVQFGQMSYGRTIQLGNIAWVDMSLNSFRSLATSRSIDMQSCRFETSLNPRHISGLATLLEGFPAVTAGANTNQTPIEPLHALVGTWKFQVARAGVVEDWLLRIEKDWSVIRKGSFRHFPAN